MATIKQKRAFKAIAENGGNISKAMVTAGYAPSIVRSTDKLVDSRGWKELMDTYLPDSLLVEKHTELLNASGIDHMVFPLAMTDEEIIALLKESNCIVKKFMHSETQTHVWYFGADNQARQKALDMAYKLKGSYAPEKSESVALNLNATLVPEVLAAAEEQLKKRKTE